MLDNAEVLELALSDLTHADMCRSAAAVLVDLAADWSGSSDLPIPPCPMIGIGDPGPTTAQQLDIVLDSRVAAEPLVEAILRCPLAAAVVTQLLRLLPQVSPAQGLIAESLAYAVLQGGREHKDWIAGRLRPAPQAEGHVSMSRTDDILTVVMERSWAGNALDRAMRDGLREAFALANADDTILKVRLRANGKAFSLGADLSEFGTTTDPTVAHAIRMRTLPAHEALKCSERLEVHVDGACVGAGLELAAFARRITATRRAWFQLPELRMGILPGAGGCVSLTRRIGRQRTLYMILSGRRIGARQALEWGLVDAIVDEDA